MRSFTQEEMIAMWRRVVSIVEPAARNPYRTASIKDSNGDTICHVSQSWRLAPDGARAIVWGNAAVHSPAWILISSEAREMALAISVLVDLAETWNEDAGQPIPEQMERLKAEEAA